MGVFQQQHADSGHKKARYRVLFLRSHYVASSLIANGLRVSRSIDYAQYPPWPEHYRARLHKLSDSEEAWCDLHINLLKDKHELIENIRKRQFDLVLIMSHTNELFAYQQKGINQKLKIWMGMLKNLRNKGLSPTRAEWKYFSSLPYSVKEMCREIPVVAIDLLDQPYLIPDNMQILKECALYCKREVPYDRFLLYQQHRPKPWRQKRQELLPRIEKVVGIPLGITDRKLHKLTALRTESQDIDVFWSGGMSNTMRITAVKLLKEFARTTGRNIVVKEDPLPFQEYCELMARSKLTLSVAGGGWDCDRHYEAIALGSLPLINRPTVNAVWWEKMPESIFFENTFSNFTSRLEQLLHSETLRQQCFQALENHLRSHMVWSKIVEYIVETAMKRISQSI